MTFDLVQCREGWCLAATVNGERYVGPYADGVVTPWRGKPTPEQVQAEQDAMVRVLGPLVIASVIGEVLTS